MNNEYKRLKSRISSYKSYWKKRGMPIGLFPDWQSQINKETPSTELERIQAEYEAFKAQPKTRVNSDLILTDEQISEFVRRQMETNQTIAEQTRIADKRVAKMRGEAPPPNPILKQYRYTRDLLSFKSAEELNEYLAMLQREKFKSFEERWTNDAVRESLGKALENQAFATGSIDDPEIMAKVRRIQNFLTARRSDGSHVLSDAQLSYLYFEGHWNFEFLYTKEEFEELLNDMLADLDESWAVPAKEAWEEMYRD